MHMLNLLNVKIMEMDETMKFLKPQQLGMECIHFAQGKLG